MRWLPVLLLIGASMLPARRAEADLQEETWRDTLASVQTSMQGSVQDSVQDSVAELRTLAEQAIVLGGAVLYRHRHTIAGATLGCAAGAAVGAGSAVAAGAATSGLALAATPEAAWLGCALGAAGGAALGYPYDHIFE